MRQGRNTGFDLATRTGARAALSTDVDAWISAMREEREIRERSEYWQLALAASRGWAQRLGATEEELATTEREAIAKPVLEGDAALAQRAPSDFTSKQRALEAVGVATHVWQSIGRALALAEERREAARLQVAAARSFLLKSERLTQADAEQLVERTLTAAGLALESVGLVVPDRERPIVDVVTAILRERGNPMTSAELIKALALRGRVVAGRNPSATLRGALIARKNSPVEQFGRGRWRLRATMAPAPGER